MGSIKNRIAAFESNQAAPQAVPSSPLLSPSSLSPVPSQSAISLQELTQGSVQAAARHRASSIGSSVSSNATALQPGADVFGKSTERTIDVMTNRGGHSPVKRTSSATLSGFQDNTTDGSSSPVKMTLNGQQVGAQSSTHLSPRLGSSEILSLYSAGQLSPSAQRFNLPSPSSSFNSLPSKSSPELSKPSVPPPMSDASRTAPPALAPKPVNLKSATSTATRPHVQVERTIPHSSSFPNTVQPPPIARPVVKDLPPSLPNRKPSLPPRSSMTGSSKGPLTTESQPLEPRNGSSISRSDSSSHRKPPPSIQSPTDSPSSVRSMLSNPSQPPPLPARKPTLPTPLPLKPSETISTSLANISSPATRRVPPPPSPLPLSSPSRRGSSSSGAPSLISSLPCNSSDKTQRESRATYHKSLTSTSSVNLDGSNLVGEKEREGAARERYNKLFTKLVALQKVGRMRVLLTRKDSAQQGWRRPEAAKTDQETESDEHPEKEQEGRLVGAVVKGIWERSHLEKESLQRIWNQTDMNQQGSLNRQEFVLGMGLIDSELGRRRSSQITGGTIRRDRRAL